VKNENGTGRIKEIMEGHPALHTLRMNYADGGRTEVWTLGDKVVRVRGGAKPFEVKAAFEAA
jgi:hypothetical protein